MRFSGLGPPFPGFNINTVERIPASYLNIYTTEILLDLKVISEIKHIGTDSRLVDLDICYDNDGTIKTFDYKFISDTGNGFKYYWLQLLPSKKVYLITSSLAEQCTYFNEIIEINEFFSFWNRLNLQRMKPTGQFEWYEINFYGSQVDYACEETKKYFIQDENFIPFGNDRLPITGYFIITSYGIVKVQDSPGEAFEGKEYTDYFFKEP